MPWAVFREIRAGKTVLVIDDEEPLWNPNSEMEALAVLARALAFRPERGSVTRCASQRMRVRIFPVASAVAIRCGSQTRAPQPLRLPGSTSTSEFGLNLVREALTARGYQVDLATDGEVGLRALGPTRYDVARCDW